MLYDEAKLKIQNADVFAFEGHSLFGSLIRLRSHSYITHVGQALWLRFGTESKDRLCVFEAMEGSGVRIVPMCLVMEQRAKAGERVHWLKLSDDFRRDEVIGFALERWGDRYSSPIQFLSSFGRVTNWVLKHLGCPSEIDKDRPFCSWLVAESLMRDGFVLKRAPAYTMPGDVFDFSCLEHQGILRLR
jgi:hypothetical protein